MPSLTTLYLDGLVPAAALSAARLLYLRYLTKKPRRRPGAPVAITWVIVWVIVWPLTLVLMVALWPLDRRGRLRRIDQAVARMELRQRERDR